MNIPAAIETAPVFSRAALRLDAEAETRRIVAALREQVLRRLRRRGIVVGLSGGIDSSVTAALCAAAFGSKRVLAVYMPEQDSDPDSLRLGQLVAQRLELPAVTENIAGILAASGCYARRDEAIRSVIPAFGEGWTCKVVLDREMRARGYNLSTLVVRSPEGAEQRRRLPLEAYLAIIAAANMKQRTRKQIEYYHADRLNYAVAGTPNRLEYDQGFFVKNGDGAADVKPIAHLYKDQVYQLAAHLKIPEEIRRRPPTTDTWSMPQSQEEFYFSVDHVTMDLCLYALENGVSASETASASGLRISEVEAVWKDIAAKRKVAAYLHAPPLTIEAIYSDTNPRQQPGRDASFADQIKSITRYGNAPYVKFLQRLGVDFEVVKAEGASVVDRAGRRYIDCVAGYGNLNIGHNHPHVIEAVVEELRSPRPFNLPFLSRAQARLAEMLAAVSPGDLECSFIVNSGSEAVDTALKLARLATGRPGIVTTRGAWHGFTFGAMSVSEASMLRAFQPLVPGVSAVPYGDVDAIAAAIDDSTAAVIVEPIQSESGAIVPPAGYLCRLAELCRERNVVLIFDEVKCGLGKVGTLWACERDGAVPDMLLTGKSLGGGAMPIGAVTARRALWGRFGFSFPMSSSSGAGNAPACAAALATLEVVKREQLAQRATRSGASIARALQRLAENYPSVVHGYSGAGLLLALHTAGAQASSSIVQRCVQRGVLVMAAFCDRSRILIEPPLNITDNDVATVCEVLSQSVHDVAHGHI